MQTTTTFKTPRARRYLKALCHHFGRKVAADCDDTRGWVQFHFGRCAMTASDTQLDLVASADSALHLRQVVTITTSHLERFAFRENPSLDWSDDIASGA